MKYIAILTISFFALVSKPAYSQWDMAFQPLPIAIAQTVSTTHSGTGKIHIPCTDLVVDYELTNALDKDISITPPHYSLGTWLKFTNHNNTAVDFIVCAMCRFQAPTINPYDLKVPYTVYGIKKDATTHEYSCDLEGGMEADYYWSFHFGCTRVHLEPEESNWALDGWRDIDPNTLKSYPAGDPTLTPYPIDLSGNSFKPNDNVTDVWRYMNYYADILQDCPINASCEAFMEQPNIDLDPNYNVLPCAANVWEAGTQSIIKKGGGVATATMPVELGNWVTMSRMGLYPARFNGILSNAPAGTQLIGYYPVDTLAGNVVIDSGRVFVDTASGCIGDSLGFTFPFLIPSMGGNMSFVLKLPPGTCHNVGNGRRIELHGEVFANSTTPSYDSSHFMYGVHGSFLADTTEPIITRFLLTQIDSTHLVIQMTGVEDTCMVSGASIKYSVNGGEVRKSICCDMKII